MSTDDPQFNLRMPLSLRRKVTAAAKANNRSVTAEINYRLEATFEADPQSPTLAAREIVDRAMMILRHLEDERAKT